MTENGPIVIIDSHYLCHRSKHGMKDLSYNEQKTGIIYGFLKTILMITQTLQPSTIVFAWDSHNSIRKQMYPNYKQRPEQDEEAKKLDALARPQFAILRREVLPKIGFMNNFIQDGYESDDIIASIVLKEQNTIVVSLDNDFYQLLDRTSLYDIGKKKFYTRKNLMEEYGVTPEQWKEVKMLSGCKGDTVKGIQYMRGSKLVTIGYNVASKYVNGILGSGAAHSAISSKEGKETTAINKPLVVLPLAGTNNFTLNMKLEHSLDGFMDMCYSYGLLSFINTNQFEKCKEAWNLC